MANTRSAIKRMRTAEVRKVRNSAVRSTVRTAIRKLREAMAKNDPAVPELLAKATRTIDKAASKGVLPSNTASRKISRLAKSVNTVAAAE